ncbi:MAG TPA: glycoside hydrolase family 16 protein [Tepidisphaeraceae bacterium]|jgi:beta-glucanase (GH16 family)|nr:glycoside hydrolase family 16 protein [Tepidisphaeraceae bacterium]
MAQTPTTSPVADPTLQRSKASPKKKVPAKASVTSFPTEAKKNTPIEMAGVPSTIISPLGRTMTLRFADEFDAVTDPKDGQPYIDRSKWQTTFWQGSSVRTLGSNGEAQYYMDKDYAGKNNIQIDQRPNPFSFEQPGILTMSAFRVPKELQANYWMGKERPFASALLISDKKFTFQYGYVEARFKLPAVRGAWPAFWLLGNDPRIGDEVQAHYWPPEADILEFFGHRPTKHSAGIHAKDGKKGKTFWGFHDVGFDITQDFHTFGYEWNDKETVFTFDGKIWGRGETPPSHCREMYILINLAVGGNWYSEEMRAAGTPYKQWEVDESTMPWKMLVDHVRVYQE